MIRGAIDLITSDRVGGWIHCSVTKLRGKLVLAFVDDACVGSGKVQLFRQDIADAGLSDGYSGFNFPISLKHVSDIGRVVVRLEECDAVLMQPGSHIDGIEIAGHSKSAGEQKSHRATSLQWMRARNWLSQAEFDFLFYINQLGVYDKSLPTVTQQAAAEKPHNSSSESAKALFGLYYMDDVGVHQDKLESVSDLGALITAIHPPTGVDLIVALWSPERGRISVVEGSHTATPKANIQGEPDNSVGSIEYIIGPDRLILLNSRCLIQAKSIAPKDGLTVFSPDFPEN